MAGTAQGTVDSLLGRLSSVLLEEGQLLSGVRGDVQFIKNEMEMMNGFLLDLANVDNPNNQVRAWTRQVRDLATDSQNCIDRYVQCLGARDTAAGGLLGCLRQVPHSARTMPTRHRIATKIRELKSRARELAERRLRYGIKVPALALTAMPQIPVVGDGAKEKEGEEERRRLADVTEILEDDVREVIGWLTEELGDDDPRGRRLRVIAVTRTLSQEREYSLARSVFDHPCASSWFDCKAWVKMNGVQRNTPRMETLRRVLRQLAPAAADDKHEPEEVVATTLDEEQLVEKIKGNLKGKRLLIVAADDPFGLVWGEIESACVQPAAGADADDGFCLPGSAIIVTAGKNWESPESSAPYKSKEYISLEPFRGNALALAGGEDQRKSALVERIVRKCNGNFFCTEMLLRALYVNPNSTEVELNNLLNSLPVLRTPIALASRKMVEFCYNGLPSHHKRCLLYLSIFPIDFEIRRTSLVRRWAAENHIARRDGTSETDESERCFSALVASGLVRPFNVGAADKVKSCKVHRHVLSFIAEIAKDENGSNTGLPPELAHRLPIRSGIQLQKRSKEDANAAEPPNTCWNRYIRKHLIPTYLQGSKAPWNSTEALIESLQASSLSGSVKVLDLEGCQGLKNRHLKLICNKIFQLKYLSLRDTDVDDLPNEIKNLRYLETLDIRQTKVRASATKSIVLRKLKHLLAGSIHSPSEEFSTVRMPRGIGHMTDLQILSHVEVSNSEKEVVDVGQLRQLRKLGVVFRGKEAFLKHLLQVITKLDECLCSLSVRMVAQGETPQDLNPIDQAPFSPPKSLVSLSISGEITGLPAWISKLVQLSKITLRDTCLRHTNALCILGNLARLHCLRLRDKSYMESKITFNKGEFQSLKFLLVEGSEIHNIHFDNGAAPKLEKITWSFTERQQPPSGVKNLPGVKYLPDLKEIVLNGDWDARSIIQDMAAHPNHPVVTHHPIRATTAAGNTSTPK